MTLQEFCRSQLQRPGPRATRGPRRTIWPFFALALMSTMSFFSCCSSLDRSRSSSRIAFCNVRWCWRIRSAGVLDRPKTDSCGGEGQHQGTVVHRAMKTTDEHVHVGLVLDASSLPVVARLPAPKEPVLTQQIDPPRAHPLLPGSVFCTSQSVIVTPCRASTWVYWSLYEVVGRCFRPEWSNSSRA